MEEIIIFNECMGVNGRMAYLYRSRETGPWTDTTTMRKG